MRRGAAATCGRRLVSVTSCALALATAPLWLLAAALVDLLRCDGGVALRTSAFLAYYLFCEFAGLTAALALWLARPFGRFDAARWRELHFRLQDAWGAALFRGMRRAFGLRLEIEGEREARLGDGPYLLLLRHVSGGDTLLASALVGRPHGMRLRYVLKRELLWDPCLDVVGTRLPHVFVDRSGDDSAREIASVQALGRELGPRDGVLIYPEGTRFSPAKRARVLARLAREGDAKRLDYASSLTSVLPPHSGGVLALLEASSEADVVVCMHRGFEGTASLSDLWRGTLLRARVNVRFLRVPRARIPATRAARVLWLRELWQQVDAWVAEGP